jgi:hypothetical protein
LAEDDAILADIWFNIAHIYICVSDLSAAEQALRISLSVDELHSERAQQFGRIAIQTAQILQSQTQL